MENISKIPAWETVITAWQKVKGAKGSIWAICLIMIVFWIATSFLDEHLIKHTLPILSPVLQFIFRILSFLLEMGLLYIGIQRAFDLPISYEQAFRTFKAKLALRIIILYILEVLIFIPLAFLIVIPTFIFYTVVHLTTTALWLTTLASFCLIVGIIGTCYIGIRLWLAMAFVLDKNVGPIQAIKLSFRATRGNFWNLVAIFLLQFLFIMVSLIPLGIGLIWTIPFAVILYGVVYKRLLVNV